ncbi:MAG: S8 family serine peptidase [Bacteroidota bacterium]|nr:S8 family serine peptidase [Bacteroidota bacterium]
MKNFDSLFRIMSMSLIFLIVCFQFAQANQPLIVKNDKDVYFFEKGEKIFPLVDYSRVYIVFSKDMSKQSIDLISAEIPSLTVLSKEEKRFSSEHSASFHLDAANPEVAKQIIRSIRELKGIESVYPFLLRNNDIASLNGQVLVNISKNELADFLKKTGTKQIIGKIDLGISTSVVFKVPANENLFDFAALMSGSALVNYAQPDFVFRGVSHFEPDDPYFSSQWFLKQSSDADIDAEEAWDITQGAGSSVVAVIDGHGFDLQQSEMLSKYLAPYCAVNHNNDPSATHPDENHGTPCVGLIGALTNNSAGVASVGYFCKVMPIRIGHDFNGGSFQTSSSIIQRAAQHITSSTYNIFAVSNSIGLGTWANIAAVRDAYESIRTQTRNGKGSVVLASTGNDDASSKEQYPCFFPNVVGVGATNSSDQRAYFSNYGDSCDIVAPGRKLWTLDRSGAEGYNFGDYHEFSGTSAACPVAAGVVGLMGTIFPNYTESQLRSKLYSACEKVGAYSYTVNNAYPFGTWNNEMGYGRVNAFLAVQGNSQLDPPTNLQASVNGSNVSLSWDAPSGGGTEELIYDNNTVTGSYHWVGSTMATRMSPSGPCKILNISYYTTGSGSFNAEIYGWNGSQPNTSTLYNTSASAVSSDWVNLDISGSNITVNGDFVVGYGSTSEANALGYDENLNNGRSWDFSGGSWSTWTETYLIRSEVEYTDGSREILRANAFPSIAGQAAPKAKGNVLKSGIITPNTIPNQAASLRGLLGYNIYRNGSKVNPSVVTATSYGDNGLAGGTYNYSVTAVYDAGESNHAGPVEVVVQGSSLPAPTNLLASNNNQNVSLSWTAPAGGNTEWISYNDGSFENSFASTDGGQGLAQQFTLPETPSTLKEVRFYVADYQNYWANIDVYILSGNGSNVLYGPVTIAGAENDWVSLAIPDLVINQSTFMIATYNVNANGPYIGVDESNYNGSLYFGAHNAGFTEMSEYDYYYVGSHEAYIEYSDGDAILNNRHAKPLSGMTSPEKLASSGDHLFKSNPKPAERGLQYYKIYRNGAYIDNTSQTSFADVLPSPGTYAYTVTAYYDEGESDPAGPASVSWSGGGSTVTVSGLVKDAVTGAPVEGALVSIAGLSDYSDSQGNYSISDVPSGALTADFSASPEWGVAPLTVQFTDLSGYGNQTITCSKAAYTTYEDDHVSVPPGAP